jgi:hypothetical protein
MPSLSATGGPVRPVFLEYHMSSEENQPNKEGNRPEDFSQKLLASGPVQSLVAERRVYDILQNLAWNAIHSCRYFEPHEQKFREVDVLANQTWALKGENNSILKTIRLQVVVECKTLKGYHLVFAPTLRDEAILSPEYWFGSRLAEPNYARILNSIRESGLEEYAQKEIFDYIGNTLSSGQDEFAHNLLPEPFFEQVLASAFRETNVGKEREVDASVLWNAGQALQSAVNSFRDAEFERDLEGMMNLLADANSLGPEDDHNGIEGLPRLIPLEDELSERWNEFSVYHPVVVIESPMWSLVDEQPTQIPWCRLQVVNQFNHRVWWFDVVNASFCSDYFRELTKHYAMAISSRGGQLAGSN